MASELKITIGAKLENGGLKDAVESETTNINQATARLVKDVIIVTNSQSDVDLSLLGTLGYARIKNLSTLGDFIQYGPKSAGAMVPFAKLKAQEQAILRLDTGITLRWVANTNSCAVLIQAWND